MTKTSKTCLTNLIFCILALSSTFATGAVSFNFSGGTFPNGICSQSLNIDASGTVSCLAGSVSTSRPFGVNNSGVNSSATCTTPGLLIKTPRDSTAPSNVECATVLPNNCALTASPSKHAYAPGEEVTLSVTCNPAASRADWTGSGIANPQTAVNSNTLSAPAQEGYYSYTATGRNDNGAGASARLMIKVSAPGRAGPYAYVPISTSATTLGVVKVIDTTINSVVTTITVGKDPFGVAMSPDGQKIYVTQRGDRNVVVIDGNSKAVASTQPFYAVEDSPLGIAVTPDGKKIYVANSGSNSISVIDTSTTAGGAVTNKSLPTGRTQPAGVAVVGTTLFVANSGSNDVSLLDTATDLFIGTVPYVQKGPYGLAAKPDGKAVYVTNSSDSTVSMIDVASKAATALITLPTGSNPRGIAINPAGTLAYVTNNGSNTVSVIDIDSSHGATYNTIVKTYPVNGPAAYGIAVAPDGSAAYVTGFAAGNGAGGNGSLSTLETVSGTTVGSPLFLDGRPSALGQFVGPAPPRCGLSPSSPTIAADGSSTLTAVNCPTATSYVWTGGNCVGSGASCVVTTAGTYTVAGKNANGTGTPDSATLTAGVAASLYTGLWYNPNESGWGMSIAQHNNTIFAVPYTYDGSGQPTWYTLSSCPIQAGACSGSIYSVTGGSSPATAWNGTNKVVSPVGTGTLTFTDANNGRFDFTVNGVQGSKAISRELFANRTPQPAVDYSDLWWNANESGWGLSLAQDHGIIFAAWYAYDANGKAVWYVASSCPLLANSCSGDLYQVAGGQPLSSAWNGTSQATKVGTVTFSFSDANTGNMAYTFIAGPAGQRSITRQPF